MLYNIGVSAGTTERVYVVLSRSASVLSRTIGVITGDPHTHSALALDGSLETMFSFGRRTASNPFIGCFKLERLDDELYIRGGRLPGTVLELPVTAAQFEAVRENIETFRRHSDDYAYNVLGLIYGIWGRSLERSNRFFCSEFVYYILRESGVCDFGVPRGLVRPQTLLRLHSRVLFQGDLLTYYKIYERENAFIHAGRAL